MSDIVEHAELYRSGDMRVLNDEPHIEKIYPMAARIAHSLRQGGEVYRRVVRVVEDWEPVEYTGRSCGSESCGTCAHEPRRSTRT